MSRLEREAAELWRVAGGLEIPAADPSSEALEGIIGEIIASTPVGKCTTEDVLDVLHFLKIPKPEQYRERIERMIRLDRGENDE